MKQLLLKSYLIILCLISGIGTGWAETYTIDFNKGTKSGTDISNDLPKSVLTLCKSGSENIASFTYDACYYNANGCGVRIAKSNGKGTFTITLSNQIKTETVAKVVVYASKVSGNNTSRLTVKPSGTVTTATTFDNAMLSAYSSENKESINYKLDDIIINGTLETLTFTAPLAGYVMLHQIDIVTNSTGQPYEKTITLNPACHDEQGRVYASYSNDKAWVVPADLTVEEIGVKDNGRLTLKAYATGAVVPANTGVMVSASAQSVRDTNGNYMVNVSAEQGSSVLGSDNRLRPASNITVAEMETKDPDCLYYRLTMHNGEQIGYWWGAENGAAFAISVSNKAYLAVPKDRMQAVKFMGIWLDDDASCISVVQGNDDANGVAFNLAGQRVKSDAKGIIIVNGKKVLNK